MTLAQDRCRAKGGRAACPKHGMKSLPTFTSANNFEEFLTSQIDVEDGDELLRSKLIAKVSASTTIHQGNKLALLTTLPDLEGEALRTWESDCAVRDELDEYEADWKELDQNIQFDVDLEKGAHQLHVELLYIPSALRKQGLGSKMLQQITATADKHGYTVSLEPNDGFGMNVMTLAKIYGSHGFQWKNTKTMVRFPQS